MKKVAFICTGNTCRSPMAQYLFNDSMTDNQKLYKQVVAVSAGVSASNQMPISHHALAALSTFGINASAHRATQVDEYFLRDCDLILTMEKRHIQYLCAFAPFVASKAHTLKNFAMQGKSEFADIQDPFGGCAQEYQECAQEIAYYIKKVIAVLKKEWEL